MEATSSRNTTCFIHKKVLHRNHMLVGNEDSVTSEIVSLHDYSLPKSPSPLMETDPCKSVNLVYGKSKAVLPRKSKKSISFEKYKKLHKLESRFSNPVDKEVSFNIVTSAARIHVKQALETHL